MQKEDEISLRFIPKKPLASDVDIAKLVELTDGFSGAKLQQLQTEQQ